MLFFHMCSLYILHGHTPCILPQDKVRFTTSSDPGNMLPHKNQTGIVKLHRNIFQGGKIFKVIKLRLITSISLSNEDKNHVKHQIHLSNYIRKYHSVFANEM